MSADTPGDAPADAVVGNMSPGEHLRAEIERLGLDQIAVSKVAGVSRQSINNIINGRQRISRAMAGKLGRLTGRSSDYWLRESFPRKHAARHPRRPLGASGVLVNHQILRAVKQGIILIEPFTRSNVQAASIELTLDEILITDRGERVDIGRTKDFVLGSGRAAKVSTGERIELPRDYIGRAGATNRMSRSGILTSVAIQIEPGFKGRLEFCVFNAGGAPFCLRAGEPIVCLEIARLGAPASE